AISTARIIDAHALQQYRKAVEDGRRSANTVRFGVMPGMQSQPRSYKPKAFPEFYKTAFSDYLNAEHLKTNGDNDIFNLLKSELELDDELPGVNAINKMAYVPSRFGTPFKYLVNAHSAFILSQRQKLTALYDIYRTGSEDAKAVEAWCYYMHGLCHGLDISAYGRNALIAALPIPDEREPFNLPPYSQQSPNATEALKTFFSNLSKELDGITKVAQNVGFNIAAYDLFVEIIVDKVYVRYAGKAHKKYAGSTFRLAEQILETYEVNLSSGKITPKGATTINPAKVPNHVKRLEERTKMVLQRVKKTPVPRQYELFQVTDKLAGLSKMLSGTVVLSFFTENNKQTWEGELANHPVLNSLHVIAGLYAPKGGLERHTAQALSDLDMVLTNQNLKQAKWLSYYNQRGIGSALTRIRNAIMNTNTALAGIGALFELGNWAEADYKGDGIGKTAALLGMSGGLAIEGAIGALGLLAGSKMAAGTVAVLTGLSYAVLGIGVVLITLAVIYDYFTPEDIELWMQNGFWGNSENYWGEAVSDKGYEWSEERSKVFKKNIFDRSLFVYTADGQLKEIPAVNYYHIEMQRYFNSGAEVIITLDKTDKHKLLIAYPGIYTEQDAKAIKIRRITGIAKNTKQVYPSWEDWRLSLEQNKIRYTLTFEQEGLAGLRIENDKLPYMNITIYSEEVDMGEYPYEELLALEIEVSVPHFRDSKYEKRKSTRLEFK
ncbi:hypothetical protein, partial [Exercitatus varius]|uniref:hypothetical protein n=1 Tax=Exercitatus varius TaxID=67857 RepID=UPI00294AAACD